MRSSCDSLESDVAARSEPSCCVAAASARSPAPLPVDGVVALEAGAEVAGAPALAAGVAGVTGVSRAQAERLATRSSIASACLLTSAQALHVGSQIAHVLRREPLRNGGHDGRVGAARVFALVGGRVALARRVLGELLDEVLRVLRTQGRIAGRRIAVARGAVAGHAGGDGA